MFLSPTKQDNKVVLPQPLEPRRPYLKLFYFFYFHHIVTRPLCLVKSHTLDVAARREHSLFTSHTFCVNNDSCILRLNKIICYDQLALICHEYSRDLKFGLLWKKRGWVTNGPDFEWDLISESPIILNLDIAAIL